MANDYNDKVSRVLSLYQRLMEGEVVDKEVEAARYGVSARSIQRDISAINDFFEQETEKSGVINSIEYDKKKGGHYLSQIYKTRLTNSEILAICKILLDSRAFTRERMEHILDILVDRCTPAEGKAIVQDLIKNEEFHYIELTHKSEFVDKMWDIGQAIHQNRYLEMDYKRTKDGAIVKRRVKPVAIMFSEYYFYLTAFIEDEEDTAYEDDIQIVKTKKFAMKPVNPEEACLQMEMLGHNFFVFLNSETEQVNVVYKRKNGTYGLIEPEF